METIVTKNYVKNLKNLSKISGIYKIVNPNGKVYIGQSIDLYRRIKSYFGSNSAKNQVILKNSFNKYGVENHNFYIIEECSVESLNERERYWQDFYIDNILNCKLTASKDKSGYCSQETKNNISKGLKKSGKSYQHFKKKVYQYGFNGVFIKEFNSLRDAARELKCNVSTISKSMKECSRNKSACGFIWSFEKKDKFVKKFGQNKVKVQQYTLDSILVNTWGSITEASIQTNSSKASIIRCCKNKQKTANNFIWKYLEI